MALRAWKLALGVLVATGVVPSQPAWLGHTYCLQVKRQFLRCLLRSCLTARDSLVLFLTMNAGLLMSRHVSAARTARRVTTTPAHAQRHNSGTKFDFSARLWPQDTPPERCAAKWQVLKSTKGALFSPV